MKALTWHGKRDMRYEDVPDPRIEQPTDAIIRVTTTGLCGSDLHLYEVLGPFIESGSVLGHESMGIVEEVGASVTGLAPGDRVVVPFNISCGHCWMCDHGLQSQCETTQVREQGTGAALFGYTKLYGQVPGGQAELLRVPQAHYGPIRVAISPIGPSPITTTLPPSGMSAYSTACQAVGSTSERYTKRSSDGPSGTLMGPKSACGTRRNCAWPPGMLP